MTTPQDKQAPARPVESLFAELVACEKRGDYRAARAIAATLRTEYGWSCVKTAPRRKDGGQ